MGAGFIACLWASRSRLETMKNIFLKIAILVALALSLCTPAQAAGNLLANPGFVPTNPGTAWDSYKTYGSINPPSWTFVTAQPTPNGPLPNTIFLNDPDNPTSNPVPSYQGSQYFFDLGGYGTPNPDIGDNLQQTFATLPGHKYKLTFGFSSEANGLPGTNTTASDPYETGKDSMQVQVGDQTQTFDSPYQTGFPNYGVSNVGGAGGGAWQMPWVERSIVFTASSTTTVV